MRFRKPHRIKRRKSIFRSQFFWFSVLALVILGSTSSFLLFSSYFQIKEIKVEDNEVNQEQIADFVSRKIARRILFFNSNSIFLFNSKKVERKILDNFPQINKVGISKKYPATLKVKVEEREPVAVFVQEEKFLIDKKGVIFKKGSNFNGLIIRNLDLDKKAKLGERVIEKETMEQILNIKSELNIDLDEIIVKGGKLTVKTSENWEIYFNLEKEIDWQITELNLVLKEIPDSERKNLNYIDLRFDKVYYK